MYEPLKEHLARAREAEVVLSFKQIEAILGCALPPSAQGGSIQQWWANTATHSQARAWLEAGRRARVVAREKRVVFSRAPGGAADSADAGIARLLAALTPAGRRFVEDSREELGVAAEQAIVAIVDQAALERRKRLLDWFATHSPRTASDSAALIREDRDAL